MKKYLLCLLCAITASVASYGTSIEKGAVNCTVIFQLKGVIGPLEGTFINIFNNNGTKFKKAVDAEGKVTFTLPQNIYDITVKPANYLLKKEKINISESQTVILDFSNYVSVTFNADIPQGYNMKSIWLQDKTGNEEKIKQSNTLSESINGYRYYIPSGKYKWKYSVALASGESPYPIETKAQSFSVEASPITLSDTFNWSNYATLEFRLTNLPVENTAAYIYLESLDSNRQSYSLGANSQGIVLFTCLKGSYNYKTVVTKCLDKTRGIVLSGDKVVNLDFSDYCLTKFTIQGLSNDYTASHISLFDRNKNEVGSSYSKYPSESNPTETNFDFYLPGGTYQWNYKIENQTIGEIPGSPLQSSFVVRQNTPIQKARFSVNDYATANIRISNIPIVSKAGEDLNYINLILHSDFDETYLFKEIPEGATEITFTQNIRKGEYTYELNFDVNDSIIVNDVKGRFDLTTNLNGTYQYPTLTPYYFNIKNKSTREVMPEFLGFILKGDELVGTFSSERDRIQAKEFVYYKESGEFTLKISPMCGYRSNSMAINDNSPKQFSIEVEKGEVSSVVMRVTDEDLEPLKDASISINNNSVPIYFGDKHKTSYFFTDIPLNTSISYSVNLIGYVNSTRVVTLNEMLYDSYYKGIPINVTLVKKGTDICSRDKVNQKISIYPIPAKETISINGNGKEGIWTAQVFASNGTLVMSQQINFSYKPIINISSLTSGIYYLRLSNNEEVNTLKIIKE